MNAASEYRKRAVETASPVGLVVLLYGGVLADLRRAIAAIDANDIERRVSELNHSLKIFAQLQATLDFAKGGEVARSLEKFYTTMRSRILEASIKNSKPILEQLLQQIGSVQEAWQQVDRETSAGFSGLMPAEPSPAIVTPRIQPAAVAV